MFQSIEDCQAYVASCGYQWLEHVFNDGGKPGKGDDCYLRITQDKSPHAINKGYSVFGWGRMPRLTCWQEACNHVLLEQATEPVKLRQLKVYKNGTLISNFPSKRSIFWYGSGIPAKIQNRLMRFWDECYELDARESSVVDKIEWSWKWSVS